MLLLYGVPMFVGCCAILWLYWERFRKPRRIHKKKIFISADCWLSVFDLLEPSQLGLGIALVSHRFDFYVDEHFKTRRWALKPMEIWPKIGKNSAKEMQIVNYDGKELPIPQKALPKKIVGFKRISINYIDKNAITFLSRFRPIFAAFPIHLAIYTDSDRILDWILRNIWPMLARNICGLQLSVRVFHRLRQFFPSILNDCRSLRVVNFHVSNLFTEFPANDSAMASDGQALAKWLFIPRPDNVPKVFKCALDPDDGDLASSIEAFKSAFANASSPANFIVVILSMSSFDGDDSVVPFDLTNELTREQLTLKSTDYCYRLLLVRCPIARDTDKWAKWEEEAIGLDFFNQWNQIDVRIYHEDEIGDGLLDTTPGPSDQQQK